MKRKWFCIALILGVVLLAACGGSDNGESGTAATEAAQTTEGSSEAAPEPTQPESTAPGTAELPEYTAADYVSLDSYTGMEVEVSDGEVTDEEFEMLLQQLVDAFKTTEKITDRETKEGDTINFDYSGAIDGVAFDGGTAQNQTTTLGNGGFIDGFEEGLIGKPCGEEFVVDAYFPDNYGREELDGKTAQFTMKINYIVGEEIIPELDDDFVKGLEDYTCGTVEEFKTVYREELNEQKSSFMEEQDKNTMWMNLINQASYSGYPDGYVDSYVQDMVTSYTSMAAAYGFTLEDFVVGMYNMDMDSFNQEVREQAELQVKSDVLCHYIADREGLTVTEEEYLAMVQEYMESFNYDDMTSFVNDYGVDNVESQGHADALLKKVIDFCFESANKVPAAETEPESIDGESAAETTSEETTAEETTAAR